MTEKDIPELAMHLVANAGVMGIIFEPKTKE